jgi:hypothetical protein
MLTAKVFRFAVYIHKVVKLAQAMEQQYLDNNNWVGRWFPRCNYMFWAPCVLLVKRQRRSAGYTKALNLIQN